MALELSKKLRTRARRQKPAAAMLCAQILGMTLPVHPSTQPLPLITHPHIWQTQVVVVVAVMSSIRHCEVSDVT